MAGFREMKATRSRTKDVVFIGLFIALITVSAWVTVPIGPIPVTLQMFAIPLAICVLRPSIATVSVYGYILLGALGVPVFSGMRGGIGALLGPTGGFLFGYLVAVPVACALLFLARRAGWVKDAPQKDPLAKGGAVFARVKQTLASSGMYVVCGILFTLISYGFGVAWFMVMTDVGLEAALAACVLPFIIPDLVKIVLAAGCANVLTPLAQRQQAGASA